MIQDASATPLDTDRPTVSTRWVLPTGNSNERGLREARGLLRRTFSLPSILSQMCPDTRDHNPSRSPQSSDHPLGFVHSTCFLGCIYAVTQSHPATLHGIERNDPSPRSSPCDLLSSIPACVEAARTQRGGMNPASSMGTITLCSFSTGRIRCSPLTISIAPFLGTLGVVCFHVVLTLWAVPETRWSPIERGVETGRVVRVWTRITTHEQPRVMTFRAQRTVSSSE